MSRSNSSSSRAGSLPFVSWNVKGLNSSVKINKVLNHLRSLSAMVAFLQETHFRRSDHNKLRRSWVGQAYHSTFTCKSRGASIIIHKAIPFKVSHTMADPNGRYIFVSGKLYNTPLVLANIYGPNWDDDGFFRKLFSAIPDLESHYLILGGDFNFCLVPTLDRSSKKPVRNSN